MAQSLFDELGLNKREARVLVDLYFEELVATLAVGEQVKLSGFGSGGRLMTTYIKDYWRKCCESREISWKNSECKC